MADEPWKNDPVVNTEDQPWLNDPSVQSLAENPMRDIWEGANLPLVHEFHGYEPSMDDSTLAAIAKAAANTGIGAANFIQSPLGILTAGVGGGLPSAARGVMAAGFAAQPAYQALTADTAQERAQGIMGAALPLVAHAALEARAGEEAPASPASESEAPAAVATPAEAETQAAAQPVPAPVQPVTARVQPKPDVSPEQADAINAEIAQDQGAPAPAEEATQPAPAVREALSLDELRLMREKSELQFEKDVQARAGNPNPPGIDERINEIDNELDEIAKGAIEPVGEAAPEGADAAVEDIRQAQEQRADEEAQLESQPDVTFAPENEQRPLDNAVEQPAGQRRTAPQQPSGVGNRGTSQAGGSARGASAPIGSAERYAEDELGSGTVIPGEGVTQQEVTDFGRNYINKGLDREAPIRVAQKTGRSGWKEVGIVNAEYDRLGAIRREAANELAKDPNNVQLHQNYADAEKAQVDWRRKMQPVYTKASDALRAIAGERPVNTSDFNDLVDFAYKNMGKNIKEMTPRERTGLAKIANQGDMLDRGTRDAAEKYRQQVRQEAGGKTMSLDELGKAAEDFVKGKVADCVV